MSERKEATALRKIARQSKHITDIPKRGKKKGGAEKTWAIEYKLPKRTSEASSLWSIFIWDGTWNTYFKKYKTEKAAQEGLKGAKKFWLSWIGRRDVDSLKLIEWRVVNTKEA